MTVSSIEVSSTNLLAKSMTAIEKVGGFQPLAPESTPTMTTPLAVPTADSNHIQSNNPYRETSSVAGTSSWEGYPSYDPPSYELATSTTGGERTSQDQSQAQSSEKSTHAEPQQPSQLRSPAPSQQSSGLVDQALARLNPRDPLDPPPPCFNRAPVSPSPTTTYEPLPHPFVIHAKPGKMFLDEAFVTTGTPALYKHDVLAEDWVRLLEDIQIVARLKGGQRVVAGALPMTMHLGFSGFFVSRAIERGMRRKNASGVTGLLDIWNERFFKPRRLEIVLCRGDWRMSESNDGKLPAPDRPSVQPRQSKGSCSVSSSSSSCSSSSESDVQTHRRGLPRDERRQLKRERRAERRARRDEHRANRDARRTEKREQRSERREERRGDRKANYRLVVVSA